MQARRALPGCFAEQNLPPRPCRHTGCDRARAGAHPHTRSRPGERNTRKTRRHNRPKPHHATVPRRPPAPPLRSVPVHVGCLFFSTKWPPAGGRTRSVRRRRACAPRSGAEVPQAPDSRSERLAKATILRLLRPVILRGSSFPKVLLSDRGRTPPIVSYYKCNKRMPARDPSLKGKAWPITLKVKHRLV